MKFVFIIFLILLTSCANYFAESEKARLQREQDKKIKQRSEDNETCKYYGFKEDSAGFRDCLMNLDIARQQLILTRKMLECEAVKRDNNQSAATGFWAGVLKGARENLACD